MLLIDQLGLEGYGIYWVLIETLRDQSNYRYPLKLLPILAKRYVTSHEKMQAVVLNYGLFQVEDEEFFFSDSLLGRMKHLDDKREKARLAGIASGKQRRKALNLAKKDEEKEQTLNGRSTDAELLKESKVNKNKIIKEKIGCFLNENNLNEKFGEVILEWLEYKKERKQSYQFKTDGSSRGFSAFCNNLFQLSKGDSEKASEIIQQSMSNNWAGIFKLNEKKNKEAAKKDTRKPKEIIQQHLPKHYHGTFYNYFMEAEDLMQDSGNGMSSTLAQNMVQLFDFLKQNKPEDSSPGIIISDYTRWLDGQGWIQDKTPTLYTSNHSVFKKFLRTEDIKLNS